MSLKLKTFYKNEIYDIGFIDFANKKVQIAIIDVNENCYMAQTISLSDIELLKYTGINDINNDELYESFIVKFKNNIIHEDTTAICIWLENRCSFAFKFLTGKFKGKYTNIVDGWRDIEIIGNKFQNPELIKT